MLQRAAVRPGAPHDARQVKLFEALERGAPEFQIPASHREIAEQPDGSEPPGGNWRLGRDRLELPEPCIAIALREGEDRFEEPCRHRTRAEARPQFPRFTCRAEPREAGGVRGGPTSVD